jgi:hypothetical protein
MSGTAQDQGTRLRVRRTLEHKKVKTVTAAQAAAYLPA